MKKWVDRLRQILFPGILEVQQREKVAGDRRNENRKSDHVIGLDQMNHHIENQTILVQEIVGVTVEIVMAIVVQVGEQMTNQVKDYMVEKLLKIDQGLGNTTRNNQENHLHHPLPAALQKIRLHHPVMNVYCCIARKPRLANRTAV